LLYSFAIASAFLFLLNLVPAWLPTGAVAADFFWLGDALAGWLVLFILAVLPTLGGYGLYMVSLTYLPASIANILATLEPVLTAILAYLLLAERFTPPQVIGAADYLGIWCWRALEQAAAQRLLIHAPQA
jgi:drug/metabolite transporter (DMT)-like permease